MATARTPDRTDVIIEVLRDAFAPLMRADPAAFRAKYRKMAREPHAFYRGTACLFFHDVTKEQDGWAAHGAEKIWIHGDLHVENFGTYLNSDGRLVFDINDFDEAYVGRFTWDLQRFAASLALVAWQKALPEDAIRKLIARAMRRADLLDDMTVMQKGIRKFADDATTRRLPREERAEVVAAFRAYLDTIPTSKRFDRELFYELRDVVGKSGFGIGSAGLPAYNVLVEGYSQALDNDVVLSMKQANIPAVSRFVDTSEVDAYFEDEGHRTSVSQRALQVHTDPLLGHTVVGGVGYVVSEVSPYEVDLDWGEINEPADMRQVVDLLGRATAKIHCASDEDSQQDLVDFDVEAAIAKSVQGRRNEFVQWLCDWGIDYAVRVREDHALFVDAFREGRVGIAST
jgi:uncharacterized protein (DUF2252 family)